MRLSLLASALLLGAACDYSGDFLFAGPVDGVPGIDHLGDILPATIVDRADLEGNARFGEVGPTRSGAKGGVTFSFRGTGDHVCVFVDPEAVFWNQSVAVTSPVPRYDYPDNVFDDGDLDLYGGLATYYNGTPAHEDNGGEIGDFRVRYEDSLDEEISLALSECNITSRLQDSGGHSGRGSPEYCTIPNTQPGVRYLMLMETWSTPLDDDRLGYGLIVANGDCDDMIEAVNARHVECLLTGETIDPETGEGFPSSEEFEAHFCDGSPMRTYCESEAAQVAQGTIDCDVDHCFCGDPSQTPTPGGF